MERVITAFVAVFLGVGTMLLYFYGSNWLLDRLLADEKEQEGVYVSRENQREAIRPWLFIGPALIVLFIYLVYPAVESLRLSFFFERFVYISEDNNYYAFQLSPDVDGVDLLIPAQEDGSLIPEAQWESQGLEPIVRDDVNLNEDFRRIERGVFGLDNYMRLLNDENFHQSIRNNALWILIVPSFSVIFGLLIAVLSDGVRWGNVARSLVFMPMAISFVGASVIWKFVYAFDADIGILNSFRVSVGAVPIDVLQIEFWNNFFLMIILIWIQTGFAMVLLGAALRGVPEETLEAARIDGAGEIQIFFGIMVPQIMGTIFVVWTTILITVLKVFDIVLAMTNGEFGSQVLANYMFDLQFTQFDSGYASLIALVIMVAVVPVMVINVRRFLQEEAYR